MYLGFDANFILFFTLDVSCEFLRLNINRVIVAYQEKLKKTYDKLKQKEKEKLYRDLNNYINRIDPFIFIKVYDINNIENNNYVYSYDKLYIKRKNYETAVEQLKEKLEEKNNKI